MFAGFNTRLFYLGLHGLGVLNYQNDEISGEHYLIHDWLPHAIKRSEPIFFDIGANVGNYTATLLKKFPRASIHAFEPHPTTFARLLTNDFPAARVTCHNLAIGESAGSLTLYDRADHDGSTHASFHKAAISEFHKQKTIESTVPVKTLDAVALDAGIDYIDFLKIDTEGHELAVLAGARRLLKQKRIGLIHFEFNSTNVYSRSFFRDFRNILIGYDLYRLLPKGMLRLGSDVAVTEVFAYQNILAVPKELDDCDPNVGSG